MNDWSGPRARLLAWYDAHARDLPWRRTRDPYAIWVSEVMLQQTRVETVVPYYERFLARFPAVSVLADAPLDDVLAHWSGLGYYRRARLLHLGAQAVAREHGGAVPRDPQQRRKLPGIGRYTAGAIGSIAFDLPEPIVDGNVARVLARSCGIDTPLGDPRTERALWREAERLAQGPRPGALNQALMELGARVCTPSNPRCDACALADVCAARREGRVTELPVAAPKRAPKPVALVALLARDDEQRLWLARGEDALFGGLWGFPLAEGSGPTLARELAGRHQLEGELERASLGSIKHVLTHRSLQVEVFALRGVRPGPGCTLRAVAERELASLGIAKLTRKILALDAPAVPD
jgi:A/G-specific adenine glycosylase